MALYSLTTKRSSEEVLERAKEYFGENGLGLSLTMENPCCVTFEGGGGHVSLTTTEQQDTVEVKLETREWDYHVQKFMSQV